MAETIFKVEFAWNEEEEKMESSFVFPEVQNDDIVEFYHMVFQEMCEKLAQVPGAEKILDIEFSAVVEEEFEFEEEDEDQS